MDIGFLKDKRLAFKFLKIFLCISLVLYYTFGRVSVKSRTNPELVVPIDDSFEYGFCSCQYAYLLLFKYVCSSVDELRKLLSDKDAYQQFLHSLDQVTIQNNIREELRKETLNVAKLGEAEQEDVTFKQMETMKQKPQMEKEFSLVANV